MPLANHGRDGNFRHLVLVPERVSAKLSSDKAPAVTSVTSQGDGAAATSTGGGRAGGICGTLMSVEGEIASRGMDSMVTVDGCWCKAQGRQAAPSTQ